VNTVLPFLITGVATGSLYSLAGLGLVVTYRTSGVFNFAHGAIAAGGAFFFYSLRDSMSWPWAAIVTLLVFGVIGGPVMEWLTRTLSDAPAAATVVVTVGIFLAVDGFLLVHYGAVTRIAPQFLPTSGFEVSGVNVSWAQVISAALALAAAIGLYLFLRVTRLGMSMRAVVDNPSLVGLAGQYPTRIRRVAWMIGSSFAALSGILLAPTLGLDATLLTLLVVQAFGGVAVGLFSSLPLTYAGGLIVGVAAALATRYFTTYPLSQIPPAVPFIILVVILLVVPLAKLPRIRITPRSLASAAAPLSRRTGAAIAVLAAVAVIFIPTMSGAHLPVWIAGMSSVVLFGSLSLLVWTSGQISLCQISFAALGATTMAHLTSHGVGWLLALVLSGALTIPIGAAIAIPAIRFSGIYLALVTFGFGLFMQYVVYPSSLMFGSTLTVKATRPHFGPVHADTSDRWQFYACAVVAGVCLAVLIAINRSRFGRLLRGLSESPTMLSTLGLDVNVTRLLLFCISAFFAGIAGALVSSQYTVSATSFNPVQSLLLVALLGVCGVLGGRLVLTAVVAALLLSVLPGYATGFDSDHQTLFFGIAAVIGGLVIANRGSLVAWMRREATVHDDRIAHSPVSDRIKRVNRSRPTPLRAAPARPRRPIGARVSRRA
jgi:branched-subunit amino acid ABC-type transport system permease component